MRAVIQRVERAKVGVEGEIVGQIGRGLLILLGVTHDDTKEDADYLAQKIVCMRICSDPDGLMNLSVKDKDEQLLVVSQFTLYGKTRRGNRPSFTDAARPDTATPLYEYFVCKVSELLGKHVPTGKFGADMQIEIVADGPVTIVMDTKQKEF